MTDSHATQIAAALGWEHGDRRHPDYYDLNDGKPSMGWRKGGAPWETNPPWVTMGMEAFALAVLEAMRERGWDVGTEMEAGKRPYRLAIFIRCRCKERSKNPAWQPEHGLHSWTDCGDAYCNNDEPDDLPTAILSACVAALKETPDA